MIHHVSLGSNDTQRARAFYDPLMSLVGLRLIKISATSLSARRFGQDSNELVDRPTEPRMRCELPIYESPPGSINLSGKPCLSPQSSANTECAKQCSEVFGNLH
ncbi:catechol 2,3-dioxygenase-like lactoylglutathione lyase family enzyme [Bradyrhizobium elkanii]|nr:catechol 2,3-dioxygenase-like lactoylglutathione lyase family enzyme [Bradyrhizobium elkanii]MCS3969753.1 catechol 2,3-dioxygenase-like lactoylglutathione lyase family enzyme [Bradyrhizobium japonicum]